MLSLCGNSFGCLSYAENAVGEEFDCVGHVITCSRCMTIAIAFVELAIGERIEWTIDEWVAESKVMEKLEGMLLYQALKPVLNQLKEHNR